VATQADVQRIALGLAGAEASRDRFAFSVMNKGKPKGFAWVWLERASPKAKRLPNPKVLAVRVKDLGQKDLMLATDKERFFTEPHYNGYPAVLVRLADVAAAELRVLLEEAWRCVAPKELLVAPSSYIDVGPTTERAMSKKRKTQVPQFGSSKPVTRDAKPLPTAVKHPVPVQRPKPPATSAKSGRRGT
jgi:hypothetical protein